MNAPPAWNAPAVGGAGGLSATATDQGRLSGRSFCLPRRRCRNWLDGLAGWGIIPACGVATGAARP
jgi:hypothetical protein